MKPKYSLVSVRASRRFFIPSILASAIAALLAVPSANAGTIWDGGGGTVDTNINTASNWDGTAPGVVNALNGTTVATFGTGGSTATINVAASFTGITINRDAAFTIADGAGALTVGSGGITVTLPNTTARAHTISESSLILSANQTWTVTNNTGAASLTVSSVISQSGSARTLTKAGTGTLNLSGTNTYSGGTTIGNNTANVGTVNITNGSALGTGPVSIVSNNGSSNFAALTLNSASGITVANNFTTSGEGQGGNGIIRNVTGDNVISGTITLASGGGGTRIHSDGGSLTLFNTIAPNIDGRTLFLGGSATGTVSGAINNGAGVNTLGGLNKVGTGTWTLSGVSNYSGTTTVTAGILRATTSASALGASALSLGGGTLQLANDTNTNFGRNTTVTATSTITADRLASAATSTTHTLGTLSIGAQTLNITRGNNIIDAGIGGITFGAATLTGAANFATGANTLATVAATNLSTFAMTKSGAGSMTATGVMSGTTAVGSTAISITNGTLTLSGANTFRGNIAVSSATAVFAMPGATYTSSAPYGASGTANVYKQLLLTNGGTFRLTSGTFNNNGTGTNQAGGIIFNIGTGGGILDIASGATLIIDDGTGTGTGGGASQLQGSGNITKTGLGIFQFDDSTAYAGTITVTAGLLQPASANAFGSSAAGTTIQSGAALNANGVTMTNAEPINLAGTGLASAAVGALTNASGNATWVGPITIATGGATIGGGAGNLTVSSPIDIGENTLALRHSAANQLTNGIISGTGNVIVSGTSTGVVGMSAASTYTGGTSLDSGFVAVGFSSTGTAGSPTDGPFGAGSTPLILNGAALRSGIAAPFTVGNTITLAADTLFNTNGSEKTLTFTGPVTMTGATRTLTANAGTSVAGTTTIFNGAIGDGGNNYGLIKSGTGNLTLGGANTYSGGTTANSGILNVTGSLLTNTALTVTPSGLGGVTFSLTSGTANPLPNVSLLTYGSVAGPTNLGFDIGANTAASDSITTPNAAVTAGTVNIGITALPGIGVGTFDLISAPSGLSGASYVLTSAPGGFTYTLSATDTLVQLGVATAAAATGDVFWRGNTNGSWSGMSGSDTNWYTTDAGTTNAQTNPSSGNTVIFSTINANMLGGVVNTTLDNNFTVNKILFGSDPNGVTAVNIAPGVTPSSALGVLTISPTSSSDGLNVASNAGNVTISAPVVLGAAQTWTVAGTGLNGSTLTVSGPVTGAGTLDISGLVTLSAAAGASTYNGATTVPSGGILQGGATNSFSASSAVTVNGTGILRLNGFSNTIAALSGSGVVQNNHTATAATLTAGDATDTTFSGILENGGVGTLGITKTGTGILALSSANTYTGATTVNAGTIRQGVANAIPVGTALTLNGTADPLVNATFDLNGFDASVTTLGGLSTGIVTDGAAGSGTSTFSITNAGASAANITNGATRAVALRVTNGNGNFSLTNGSNTFSGGIVLTNSIGGTRMSPGTITAGAYGTGAITVGEAATDLAGILFSTASQTLTNDIIINTALGTDRVGIRSDVSGITLSGQITANLAPVTFSSNGTGAITLSGKVTGSQGLILDSATSGAGITITLNNSAADNDYTGDTVIGQNATAGRNRTLQVGTAEQIPHGTGKGNVIINTNGTGIGLLSLAAVNETINGLSGNGNVASTSGTVTLTLGDNNATATHSGAINNTAGTLSVTKIGSGTQTLASPTGATGSNFAGALNVNGGFVAFPSSPATLGPLGNSTVVNLDGGGISYTSAGPNALNRSVVIGAAAGTVDVVNSAGVLNIATVSSTAGNLIKTGVGTAVISDSTTLNSGLAGVAVNEGTLQAGFGTGGVAAISVGATGNLDQRNSAIEALVLGNSAGALTLANGAQLGFEVTNTPTNDSIAVGASGTAVTAGVVTLNLFGTVAAGTYNLITAPSGLSGATYVLGAAPSGFNYTITATDSLVSISVVAEVPIYWRGGQNLSWNTLGSGSANWTADSAGLVDASSIPVATDSVIFSATGAPTVTNTITTTLDAAFTVNSLQFTNSPSGITDATITEGTGGALTISPASPINGIRVLAGGGNTTISAPLTIGAAQTWDVDPTGSLTISGSTVFTGSVNKTNTGALTISGNNSGAGAITLSGGTLNLNSATALGTGVFTIGAGTTINTPLTANTLTNNNVQNWNGNFTFTGTNDLNLGTGAVTLGSSIIATTSASVLTVGGNIGDGGNNRGLTKTGAGTMILNGANTYTGATAITGGVLRITNNTGLGTAAGGVTQTGSSALELDGTGGAITVGAESLTINGGGVTLPTPNLGALRNMAGDNTYGGTITLATQARINSDSGTLTLSNPIAVSSSNLNLVVGGAGNITISGAIATGAGGVTKDGAGTLTLSGNSTYTGNTTINGGVFNLTGSLTGTVGSSALRYGDTAGNTVVNISGNVNSYRIFTGANVAGSVAVMNQTAGSVTIVPPNAADDQYLSNNGGYGMWNITGGTFNTARFDGTGLTNGNASTAVIYVGGSGALTQNVGDWFLPIRNSGNMSMTVAPGGSFTRSAAVTAQFSITGLSMTSTNNASYGMLNVAGGNVDTGTRGINFGQGTFASGTFTSDGFLNVAGGTLSLGLNIATGTAAVGTNNSYINFAGGTLRATAGLTAVIPASTANYIFTSTVFGAITNNNNANTAFNTQIGSTSNFTGGLVVDTNNFPVTFTNPLLVASGYAVTQDNIGDVSGLAGNSGYVGAPMVRFAAPSGGGVPATGYALLSGDKVSGIVITNPGTYTENETPTITLTGGGGSIAPFNTSPLTTNNTSGGLTKLGANTLTLSGANTFSGATLVSAGRLQLDGAAAGTPSTSAITVGGTGTLGFTTAATNALDLTGKSMTLSGGTLNFDLGASGINDTITVDNFTLTANSAFTFNALSGLSAGDTYTLVSSANPINSGGFTLTGQTIGRVTLTPAIVGNTIIVTATVDESAWGVDSGGNWSLGTNWTGYLPEIAGDAALFGSVITAPRAVIVDTPQSVGFIRFNNANAYTIGANGSSNLTLNNSANNAVVTVTTGSHTIAENVFLASNMVAQPAATTTLTMSGVVSGARNVQVNGAGTVELTGANTYSGTTTVSNGVLTLSGARTATMGAIMVGNLLSTTATLNISNGTMTTGVFNVGSGDNPLTAGIVNQTGGTLTMSGNQLLLGNGGTGTTAGSNSTGTYNLSGGTLNTVAGLGVLLGVNTGATGVFNLSSGGVLNMASTSLLGIARSDNNLATNTTGTFNQTGGTATVGILQLAGSVAVNNAGGNAALSLTGGTFSATTFNALSGGNNSSSTITIGGTAQVTLPAFPTNAKGSGATATITFDSSTGFLSPVAASATYIPAGTFTNAYLTDNGAKFNVPSGRDITIAQVLQDAEAPAAVGTLTKEGLGILALSGTNTYTGLTSVNAGMLSVGNIDALGSTAAETAVVSGARVTFNSLATNLTVAEPFTVQGTGTTATNGVLNMGGNKNVNLSGAITLSGDALFTADGGSSLNFTGASSITGSNTNLAFNTDGSVASSITGPISLGTGGLTKTGGSTLILSGDNSYAGATTINGGTLAITHNNALGTTVGSTTVNGGNGTGANTLSLTNATTGLTIAEPINFFGSAAGRAQVVLNAAQNHTFTGPIDVSSSSNLVQFVSSNSSGSITISGDITGTMSSGAVLFLRGESTNALNQVIGSINLTGGNLAKTDGGTWVVGAPGKTYSWVDTGVANGTLRMGSANVLPSTSVAIMGNPSGGSTGAIDLNGFDQTIAGITYNDNGTSSTGTRTITSTTAATLTVNNAADFSPTATTTPGTANSVRLTGALALTKQGAGSLTLSGANTHTGGTSVTGGSLFINGTNAGSVSVATTGTLGGNGTIAGATTVASGGTVSPGRNSVASLNFSSTLALDSGSNYAATITGTAANQSDRVIVAGDLTADGKIVVTLSGYVPVLNDSFDIADVTGLTTGDYSFDFTAAALSSGLAWDYSTFKDDGKIKVINGDPFQAWANGFGLLDGDAAKSADPDGDGMNNLLEFATNSNPKNGGSGARVYPKIHVIGGSPVLTYTVATRAVATFADNGSKQEAIKDLVKYTIEGSDDLTTWNTVVVSEVEGDDAASVRSAIVPALPNLDSGWEWHTFRTEGDTATDSSDYMRLRVTDATPQ